MEYLTKVLAVGVVVAVLHYLYAAISGSIRGDFNPLDTLVATLRFTVLAMAAIVVAEFLIGLIKRKS